MKNIYGLACGAVRLPAAQAELAVSLLAKD